MKREARHFRNRYIFSTPNMALGPHIAFSPHRFTTAPKRASNKREHCFSGEGPPQAVFYLYRKKGSKASFYWKLPRRSTPVPGMEHRVTPQIPHRPTSSEEQPSQAVHADIQRSVKVLQGLTYWNTPPRPVPDRRGRGSD